MILRTISTIALKVVLNKNRARIILALFIMLFGSLSADAQNPTDSVPPDPGAITVYTMQNMSFGAFSAGNSGGTISIGTNGIRSVTGDVVPLNMGVQFHPALFEVDAVEGSILSIMNGSSIALTGNNGGTINLQLGTSDPPSPFITTVPQPQRTTVQLGGTLTIGNSTVNPPGTYSGTFYITFNQE